MSGMPPEIHDHGESVPVPDRDADDGNPPPPSHRRKFVLCFDGTGNKFSGTDSDSNILKIYRMLDRTDHTQFHYYQPGIGTYVTSNTLSHTSTFSRFKSWYAKAKDSAVGTSFDQHVIGGYKFLMRYYRPNDEIYFFGFSRGAYTARFLAEMIDHVGLLSQGNEELIRFAWKTFEKWQARQERTVKEKKEKKYQLDYMCAFRETFSRPVRPIQFLGLFDTVNSVPRFENALMSRSKFPYTARSSARVIRHAVSIGERRAKFRQDLISDKKKGKKVRYRARHRHLQHHRAVVADRATSEHPPANLAAGEEAERGRRTTLSVPGRGEELFRDASEVSGVQSLSANLSAVSAMSASDTASHESLRVFQHAMPELDSDEDEEQDIQEVWFAGCHADIGGGWPMEDDEEVPLSHIPLVWMVREAQRAGLRFDPVKLRALHCAPEEHEKHLRPKCDVTMNVPQIITTPPPLEDTKDKVGTHDPEKSIKRTGNATEPVANGIKHNSPKAEDNQDSNVLPEDLPEFHKKLHAAATRGRIHDVLCFNNGVGAFSVAAWNFMEYLPFRRMDLQDDGSWKSITWPLPKGEVRDIPEGVVVHNSVLRRMHAHEKYRPGNLICGGGGRGVRFAPPELGIGEWTVLREEGDWVGEVYVRAGKPVGTQQVSGRGLKKLFGDKNTMKNGTMNGKKKNAEKEAKTNGFKTNGFKA